MIVAAFCKYRILTGCFCWHSGLFAFMPFILYQAMQLFCGVLTSEEMAERLLYFLFKNVSGDWKESPN